MNGTQEQPTARVVLHVADAQAIDVVCRNPCCNGIGTPVGWTFTTPVDRFIWTRRNPAIYPQFDHDFPPARAGVAFRCQRCGNEWTQLYEQARFDQVTE